MTVETETPLIDPYAEVSAREDTIRRALYDPAKWVPRGRCRAGDGYEPEALHRWQARAVMAALNPPPPPPVPRWARNLSRVLYGLAAVTLTLGLLLTVLVEAPFWGPLVTTSTVPVWVAAVMLRVHRPEPKEGAKP